MWTLQGSCSVSVHPTSEYITITKQRLHEFHTKSDYNGSLTVAPKLVREQCKLQDVPLRHSGTICDACSLSRCVYERGPKASMVDKICGEYTSMILMNERAMLHEQDNNLISDHQL